VLKVSEHGRTAFTKKCSVCGSQPKRHEKHHDLTPRREVEPRTEMFIVHANPETAEVARGEYSSKMKEAPVGCGIIVVSIQGARL
jgi:hypothetical protein